MKRDAYIRLLTVWNSEKQVISNKKLDLNNYYVITFTP